MTDRYPTLTPDLLLQGYAQGVFPMAEHRDDPDLFWVDPTVRGVLPISGFHISRSLARRMRRGDYGVTLNRSFDAVVAACAARRETWISRDIASLYGALHRQGDAHSLEIWEEERLTGGVYGVSLGAAFFGESMFSRETDASKLALAHLVDHLARCGYVLFDTQFLTPHLASLGAVEISRRDYHILLADALARQASVGAEPLSQDPQEVLQRMTHTS